MYLACSMLAMESILKQDNANYRRNDLFIDVIKIVEFRSFYEQENNCSYKFDLYSNYF